MNSLLPIIEIQEEKKINSLAQLASLITDFSEYIRVETKKLAGQELIRIILNETEDQQITVRKCREALEVNPNDPVANTSLAKNYLIKDKINMAIKHLKKSLELFPDYQEAIFFMSFSYYIQDKMDLALEYLTKLEVKPELLNSCIMGYSYHNSNVSDRAISCFKSAIEEEEYSLPACIGLGHIYTSEGNIDMAVDLYREAIQRGYNAVPVFINLAFNLYLMGELSESLAILEGILEVFPPMAITYFSYGFFLFQNENYQEAIEYYGKALDLEKANHLFYNARAFLYMNIDKLDEAIEDYEKSVKFKDDYLTARYGLAFALQVSGNLEKALEEYNEIILKDPGNSIVEYNRGTILRLTGKYDEAIEACTKAINIDNNIPYIYTGLGLAYLEKWVKGQKSDNTLLLLARENISKALNLDEESFMAKVSMGIIYRLIENIPEAIKHFENILSNSPELFTARAHLYYSYLTMADKLYHQGKMALAIYNCQKAIELNPDEEKEPLLKGGKDKFITYSEKIGDLFYKKGLISKALEHYKSIMNIDQMIPRINHKIGIMYNIRKEFDLAEIFFQNAIAIEQSFDPSYYTLAVIYKNKGEDRKALEHFQKYLSLAPSGLYGEEARKKIKELEEKLPPIPVAEEKTSLSYGKEEIITETEGKIFIQENIIAWDTISSEYQKTNKISISDIHYGPFIKGEKALNLIPDIYGKKILDLGCGGGQNSVIIASMGGIVTAIDFSEEQIEFARNLSAQSGTEVDFINGYIEDLSFLPSEEYDIVISVGTLDYIENIKGVFRGVKKVIKDGGTFIFSVEHPMKKNISEENIVKINGRIYPFMDNYYTTGEREILHPSGEVKFITFKRKFEEIINPLLQEGFKIVTILEMPLMDINSMTEEELNTIPFISEKQEHYYNVPGTLIIKTTI